MHKLILAGLALLCLQQNARGVELAEDGIGDVLLFPYFTTRGSNTTLLKIENIGQDIHALKIRILEGDNGEALSSFNIYLGPFDTWTASLVYNGDQTLLRTRDPSCTVPRFFDEQTGEGELVLGENLLDNLAANPNSGRPRVDRIREGHINVISMARLVGPEAGFVVTSFTGFPRDCQAIVDMWDDSGNPPGIWTSDPNHNVIFASSDIRGEATIINVGSSRAANYPAVALQDFYVPDESQSISLHAGPDDDSVVLDNAFPAISKVSPNIIPADLDEPQGTITDTWDTGLQAVDAVLTTAFTASPLAAEPVIGGGTEWVVTFPTKRQHVFNPDGSATPPFTIAFGQDGSDGACEPFRYTIIDRSSRLHPYLRRGAAGDLPPTHFPVSLCYQVNVLTYTDTALSTDATTHEQKNEQSRLLGSRLFTSMDINPADGERFLLSGFNLPGQPALTTGTFTFDYAAQASGALRTVENPVSGNIYYGAPAIGFNLRAAESATTNSFFGITKSFLYNRRIDPGDQ